MDAFDELSGAELGATFESAVLSAVQAEPPYPLSTWSAAYEMLSAALTADRESVLSTAPSATLGGAAETAVAGLIYASRTAQIARRLLRAYPPPPGRFLEIGAGWGPVGAVAAALGADPVELWDLASRPLELAPALFHALALPPPSLVRGDARTVRAPAAGIAAAFSLNEMLARHPSATRAAEGAAIVRGWLSALIPGGRLYLFEPGLFETSQVLQGIRDELAAEIRILGPCVHQNRCPIAGSARDWCHFTLPVSLGPVGQTLANQARRQHAEAHVSWLILEASPPEPIRIGRARILDARERRNRRVELTACTDSGYEHLVALGRTPEMRSLADLSSGTLVQLDRTKLLEKGDGLRIEAPSALQLLRDT